MKPFYLYPPRPISRIRPEDLPLYENLGYISQLKYNGSRSVITITPDGFSIWNRQGTPFSTLHVTSDIKNLFKDLNVKSNETVVLDAEWLGTKAVSKITGEQAVKDTLVLFDILYFNKHLTDMIQTDRLKLLSDICNNPSKLEEKRRGFEVSQSNQSSLWLAPYWDKDHQYHFYDYYEFDKEIDMFPDVEGIVLRRANGKLQNGTKPYTTGNIIRCRKPAKRSGKF